MKKHIYESDYGTVECKYFFDADSGNDGADIYVDGDHVGEIWNANIPSEYDEDEDIKKFEDGVDEWLSRNY